MEPLVAALGELTRPNVLELSRRLGLARNTVQARLDRLQQSGVIVGWGPVVDLKAMGYDVLAFVTLEIAQGQEEAALAELTAIPEVLEIHKTTGPGDLICRVVARTNDHLHVVLEKVLASPGVQRTTSSLALNSPKLRVHPDAKSVDELPTERLWEHGRMDADASPAAAALHEIADGVFAWVQPDGTWWINNTGAVTAIGGDGTHDGGTVIVDTCATHERTRRFLDAVAAATGLAPIAMAVNTHQHGDHTYGNSLLPRETVIIGHTAMRAGLLADTIIDGCPPVWTPVPDWGPVTRRVPSIAVDDHLTIYAGTRRIELHHPGYPAHTTGDVVAWLPDERVLFTGDLVFNGLTPLVFMGSVSGARRSLEWLASFEPAVVVPGHGPVAGAASIADMFEAHDRYYRLVESTAEDGRRDGHSVLEAARQCDLGEFAGWADSERLVLNLHRAYADALGAEMDLFAAMIDAVEYNGGPLTTHVCGT